MLSPAAPISLALDQLGELPHVDSSVIDDAQVIVRRGEARALAECDLRYLIHGDLVRENVLWDGQQISAILDFR
ncbi:MAG: phosphotransferase [Acidimicrobiales bacterium]